MAEGMYMWAMPTERLKADYKTRLAEQEAIIAQLRRRIAALEVFLPDGLDIDDAGQVVVKISGMVGAEAPGDQIEDAAFRYTYTEAGTYRVKGFGLPRKASDV